MNGALGVPHQHPFGIPQGCPFSMIFVGLLLRPWQLQMIALGAIPRTLADDLLLMAKGSRALHLFSFAFNATIEHLQDMGGRIAPKKSKLFATLTEHRQWLEAFQWPALQQVISVVHQMRDLGASLSTTFVANTSLSRERLRKAIEVLKRIRNLPYAMRQKVQFVLSCAHAQAFYGCEASPVDESALKSYTSLLLQVVGTSNTHHARALIFALLDGPASIDPIVHIFTQRAMMMRRALIKIPAITPIVELLFQHYQRLEMFGAYRGSLEHNSLVPAPLPGGDRRGAWKWHPAPPGPVGILLENTHLLGCSVQLPNFTFRSKFGPNLYMLTDPYNHLQPALHEFALRAVHTDAERSRTVLHGCTQIDGQIFKEAAATLSADVRGAAYGVATLSVADQSYIHQLDPNQTGLCPYCQKCPCSVPHIIFDCDHPKLIGARENFSEDAKLATIEKHILEISHALPPFLQHGIPPPLALMPDTPWWTNVASTELSNATRAVKNTYGIEDQFIGDSIFLNWLRPHAHHSAKVAFATMNGAGKQHDIPEVPQQVEGSPPEKANAFSDGSFSRPELPMYSLTSAGIWWPERDVQNYPLSNLEEDSARHVQRKSGLELLSFLNGPISSSSRAELLGLIVTIMSKLPVHVALDSAAVLSPASRIVGFLTSSPSFLSRLRARLPQSVVDIPHMPLPRQIAFMANSDLWLIFIRTLAMRGPHTVKLTKTKGHALEIEGYLENKPELRHEAIQNDIADNVARDARALFHHPELVKLSKALGDRHHRYVLFMRALLSIIGRVHLESQRVRASPAFQLAHPENGMPKYITFEPIWNIADLRYQPLLLKCSASMLSHHMLKHSSMMMGFTRLILRGCFAKSPTSSGYTWLEIMLLSIALSDSPLSHVRSHDAQSQKVLTHQLREFATAATTILKFMLKVAPQTMFLASTQLPNRMRSYGYHNRLTHTCAHIALTTDTQQALHVLMLSLKAPLSKDQLAAYANNNLQLKTAKFSGHHLVRGTAALMNLSALVKQELNVQVASFVEIPPQSTDTNFFCPRGHARCAYSQFDPHHVQKSVWCQTCRGAHASTAWTCPCNRPWFNCPEHFGLPLQAPTKARTQHHGSKRQRVDTAQVSARKLTRLEPSVASRPILSPNLAKRFPHLAGGPTVAGHTTYKDDDDQGPSGSSGSGSRWPHRNV